MVSKELKLKNGGNVEAAKQVGELIAKRAKKAKKPPNSMPQKKHWS